MRPFGRSRSRPAVARDLFERARWRYFQVQPGMRRLAFILLIVCAAAVSLAAGGPLLITVVLVATLLLIVDFMMRSPSATATALVTACWLAAVIPLGRLYPGDGHEAVFLALLALPVAFLGHRIHAYAPWRTTLAALGLAGVVAAALAHPLPRLNAAPARVTAFAELAFRWRPA